MAMITLASLEMLTPCNSKHGGQACHDAAGADNALDMSGEC